MLVRSTIIATWTNVSWPFIVLDPDPTRSVALQHIQERCDVHHSLAGVVLAALPHIIVFAVAGRQLVSGIMQGAVQG